ncbi:MAG: peptide ABC transporter substrate-binding protein [Streptococcaceae bacterium]|jgi:oligopeptide transport system substrate-binding protein|nr:peptide ABC transporter substrate-binding protein [Streptococcaceae bacterium]
MKNWKKLTLTTAAALAAFSLAACSSSGDKGAGSSTRNPKFAIPADINTIDQSLATDQYSNTVIGNTGEGLTRVSKDGKAKPAAAETIDVSSDGLTYTITLRDGLKWSNGDDLTAKDFVFSWQRGVDPATASEYAYLMTNLKNAQAIMDGKMDKSALGVKAESDTKLVVTLEAPTPYLKFLFSQAIFFPENQAVVEKYGKQYGTSSDKMVYNGPYKFGSDNGWNGSNKEFTIVKNDQYWDKSKVKSKAIDIQVISDGQTAAELFKQNKIDLAFLNTPDLVKAYKGNKNFTTFHQARTDYLEYAQDGSVPALQNEKIRLALNLATNRQGAIDVAAPGSTVATSFSPVGLSKTADGQDFAEFAKQGYSYDAAKAKDAWTAGLKELGTDKVTLALTAASDLPISKATAEYLKQNWEKNLPGLTVDLKLVPFKQRLEDAKNKNFQIVLSGWGGDYAEPTTFLNMFITGNSYNYGQFSSKEYDAAYEKASTLPDVTDPKALDADYKACETALFEGSYINPIDFQASPVLLNTKLKGFDFHSTGLNYDFKTVQWK